MIRFSVQQPGPTAAGVRWPMLTALRGLAILLVVLYHGGGVLVWEDRLHGEIGVDIFLLVSGFLLSFASADIPAREFLRRRFFRIFPAYWMALALFVVLGRVLLHRIFTWPDVLVHLAGMQATVQGAYASDINNSFWFITTIGFLYLVFLGLRRRVRDLPFVLGVGGLTTLLCLLPFPGFANLSGRLLGFYLGICLGQLRRGGDFSLRPGVVFAAGAAAFAVLEWRGSTSFLYPLAAVAVIALFAVLDRALRPWRAGRLLLAPLEFLGVYSYEIYLFHQPLIGEYNFWFQRNLLRREPSHRELAAGMLVAFLVAIGLAMAAAAIGRRRRLQAWTLAVAGAALLLLAAGGGPLVAQAGDRFVAAVRRPLRPPPVTIAPGSQWDTSAPASRSLAGWCGPLRLEVELPARVGAPAEPLIVTGRSGRGDLLGVIRVDARHIRFTCDHWGFYSLASPDILLGEGPRHVIEVSLGSMLPPAELPWTAAHAALRPLDRRLYVAIDGREALDRDTEFHPAGPTEAFVGFNPLGGSTTVLRFTGRILRIESLDPRRLQEKISAAKVP